VNNKDQLQQVALGVEKGRDSGGDSAVVTVAD
jgi:hypothetical protein